MKIQWHIIGLLLVLFSSQAESSSHKLRVGTYQISPTEKWVLLGIEGTPGDPNAGLDFQQIGFQGNGLDHIDPKFLIELNSEGVQKVRSFDLEPLSSDQIEEAEKKLGLPPLLLDANHSRRDKYRHATGNAFAFIGKSLGFPIATATALATFPRKHREDTRKIQAYYLMELVNKSLPPFNGFPEFSQALSDSPTEASRILAKLGEALLIRFHPKSNWIGIHAPYENNGQFYEKWRQVQAGKRVINAGLLTERANTSGLSVIHMGGDFAFVFYRQVESTGEILTPWYLASFANEDGPVELTDFMFPGKIGEKLQELSYWSIGRELGGSIIPLTNILAKAIHKGYIDSAAKNHNTQYLKRLEAFGSVLALTETRFFTPNPLEGIEYEEFRRALGRPVSDIPEDQIDNEETLNQVAALIVSNEERIGRYLGAPTMEQTRRSKKALQIRLSNYLSNSKSASRSPCGLSQSKSKKSEPYRKPVILFLIDGLRPDRFLNAAREGLFPNLKSLFIDRGTHLKSFTSRSLTLPSWATIFTGFEGDYHGIRSNAPISKTKRNTTDNYLDPWADVFNPKNVFKNRAYRRLEEDQAGEKGKIWLPGYFKPKEAHLNYMPISFRPNYPIRNLLSDYFKFHSSYLNGVRFMASALDVASAKKTAKAILNDRNSGNLRLVMNWYASVDEASHHNNRQLPTVYQELDQAIGTVLQAAKQHPHLKDATVFLISDHGHTGGFGPYDQNSTLYQLETPFFGATEGPLLANTDFNLTHLFSGASLNAENYGFRVGAVETHETKFDLGLMDEFIIPRLKMTRPKQNRHATVLIDNIGDNMTQIYLLGDSNPDEDLTYHRLTHFQGNDTDTPINIVSDLLNHKIQNLLVSDRGLLNQITRLTSHHPIRLFAMPLKGEAAKVTSDKLGADSYTGPSDRDPILIVAKKKNSSEFRTGIIFTRNDSHGDDLFRYVVVRNFIQNSNGSIEAQVSDSAEDDPLDYLSQVIKPKSFSEWRTDREWIALTENHSFPTAIFSLARTLTLSPRYTELNSIELSTKVKRNRQSETPDFLLLSNPGFAFRTKGPMESDHGGLSPEEVKNCFYISSLNESRFNTHVDLESPVFSRDMMPTILSFAGLGEDQNDPLPITQGQNLKDWILKQGR